ncbi:MAG: SDR family NAD(P)-dependent oxidoreductase [Vicingaceae bacterium]
MGKTIFITGATSGFGKASALIFAEKGHHLIITGRRKDRLEILLKTIQNKYDVKVTTLCFDVRKNEEVVAAVNSLSNKKIDVLINNAGLASGLNKIQDGLLDDWEKMIDTNIKGLLYVSKAIIPLMIKQQSGHIINIGSTAGKEAYEKGNVYCATKHAVDALSKSMRIDLLGKGIKVSQICPGAAETEFSEVRLHGDTEKAKKVYEGYEPMSAKDVASIIYYVTTLPKNLCINDLIVTSLSQASSHYINKI